MYRNVIAKGLDESPCASQPSFVQVSCFRKNRRWGEENQAREKADSYGRLLFFPGFRINSLDRQRAAVLTRLRQGRVAVLQIGM